MTVIKIGTKRTVLFFVDQAAVRLEADFMFWGRRSCSLKVSSMLNSAEQAPGYSIMVQISTAAEIKPRMTIAAIVQLTQIFPKRFSWPIAPLLLRVTES